MDTLTTGINTTSEKKEQKTMWLENISKDVKDALIWPASDWLYTKNPIKSDNDVADIVTDVEENLKENHFNKKNIKLVNNVLIETCDNIIRYTPEKYKDDTEIKIRKWKEWKYLFINSLNYFDNWEKDENTFTNKINELEKLNASELKAKEIEMKDQNKDLHEKWWAGRWYVSIMRKIKTFAEKNGIPDIKNIIDTQIKKIWKIKFKFEINIKIPINPPLPDMWMAV